MRHYTWSSRIVRACCLFMLVAAVGLVNADLSRSGGAGYALLLRDHGIVVENVQGMDTDAFTFETWLSTSDFCHKSAIMSYAQQPSSDDPHSRTAAFNDFVVFDPSNLVACRGFEYIDLWPDPSEQSCYSKFNHSLNLPDFIERDGRWRHLSVSWTAANNGLTRIYMDGLLRAETPTGKTERLRSGGALMLGNEQDCYGGCTDLAQSYHGLLDEVRLWRVARTQEDILTHMRDATGLENHPDLIAYYKFNDPEENGMYRLTAKAADSSGKGNHIPLAKTPTTSIQTIQQNGKSLSTGVLSFANNYAMNQEFQGMPDRDITVAFWARTPKYNVSDDLKLWSEFFNFASFINNEGRAETQFIDDAILIEKYTEEFSGTHYMDYQPIKTAGSLSVHINANREGMGQANDHWLDFNVGWVDDAWHHVAVTWSQATGEVQLYFDGKAQTPFWSSKAGVIQVKDPAKGGVDRHIAAGSLRNTQGSLVLGNKQETYGGGFSPQYTSHGDLASLRIWNRVISEKEVAETMFTADPPNKDGLTFSYNFDPSYLEAVGTKDNSVTRLLDKFTDKHNDLYFGADYPTYVYSTAPLVDTLGVPVAPPMPGAAGHAMHLSDQQVLIRKNFKDFPSDEITVEFYMLTTDNCRKGTPFSYASAGATYNNNHNTFLISDYNDWVISVLEDEGYMIDHTAGISAADGKWHHIAVTWRSSDGVAKLYDNGKEVWNVVRSRGKKLPSGGTLVVGREQDMDGGAFDSSYGAAGDVSDDWSLEYGSQDFFGVIDELRIWKKVRTPEQIVAGMRASLYIKGATGERSPSGTDPLAAGIDPHDPDLVAYYNFDEGQGYVVRDVTGRGNDLIATQPPKWEVVKAMSICGNGLLEGLEECDDGDNAGGNGCSGECKVEEGWECTVTSPSVCWKKGEVPPPDARKRPDAPPYPPPSPPPGGSSPHKHTSKFLHFLRVTFTITIVFGLAGIAFVRRQDIFDHFPAVEHTYHTASERVKGFMGQRYRYGGDLSLDADDHAGPPDFSTFRPAPAAARAGYSSLSSGEV